ncbi:MAG: type II secretion system protein GspD, partial [Blastopirellula sp. JB062]
RPFITDDGMVRLEVHPEISDGDVQVENQITLPNKVVTQVTTNVICPDGRTIIIGGLIKSDIRTNGTQIPYLGSIPVIGPAFRQKTDKTVRDELIVLLTPRIVDAGHIPSDGEALQDVFEQQHENMADKMSPLGKRYLGRKYYRLATSAWATGDAYSALRYCNLSIHFDPTSLEATELRSVITSQTGIGDRSVMTHLREGWLPPSPPHRVEVSPWHIEQVQTPAPVVVPQDASPAPYPAEMVP